MNSNEDACSWGDLLGIVDVEEVGVQNCLDDACNNGNWVVEAWHIKEVAVDPVGNVQRPVCAEREQIVGCDCLCLAGSLQHKELWEDGDRFKPNGECPEDLYLVSTCS